MKKSLFSLTAIACSFALLASCGQQKLNDPALVGEEIAKFNTTERAPTFFESNDWTNGDVFNCYWKKSNVNYTESGAKLSITPNADGSAETNNGYFGGELRSYQYFGYGDFKVRMKPAKEAGTASTFFTCTGPYDSDEEGNPNPHDEIDIEFLGKDTTKVQFNYFVNGKGGHEYLYKLPFDASKEFHTYGYRWSQDSICWFVDDKPVYKVTASANNPLPSTPGRMLMNYWCGTPKAENWMGKYQGDGSKFCEYDAVYTSAKAIGDLPKPSEEEDLGEATPVDMTSLSYGTEGYTITPDAAAKALNVAYSELEGASYKNVVLPVAETAVGKTAFRMKIKNNGTEEATIRLDVQGTKHDGKADACNTSASATEEIEVATDLEWGGSSLAIPAGKETEVTVHYTSNGTHGTAKNILVFLDSSKYGDTSKHTNNITLSDLRFYGEETVLPPEEESSSSEPAPEPSESESSSSEPADDGYVAMDLSGVDGWGNYTVDKTDGIKISHAAAISRYGCCGYGGMNLSGVTKIKFDVANLDATNASNFKITIKHDGDSDPCNAITKMKINDGSWADENGGGYGATVDIPVGATYTLEFQIDATKNADTMVFSIDSQNASNVATGSIKITNAKWNKAA